MKILYTNFHHRNGGGHVTYIINLAKRLSAGHDISVATPGTSRLYAQARALGCRTFDRRFTSRVGPMIAEVRELRALIREERFDVIHVNASADHRHVMLATLGMANRPRIVWTKHNDHNVSSFGHRLRAVLGTDAVIAVSSFIQSMLDASPYAAKPRFVIRHGIDTDFFRPVSDERKHELRQQLLGQAAENNVVFGSSGGTDYEKGWLDLVKAVATLDASLRERVRIVVAGDPPKQHYLSVVEQLGMTEQVIFPGLVENIHDILGACDVGFVLSYREALSFACRETMALGLPTLVSNAGGLPENIRDGHDGWIVPVADVRAIAACVGAIVERPEQLTSMGRNARLKSETEFSLAGFANDTLAVYEHVLGKA